ncbi:response regulator [Lutispora thermophila]|uniref:Stage 0 sporulation protein A homolog n=1 Tax=Lutispora thermophila DSM 19022 TaxID=1122184 RepID=A0A1M6B8P3_9FIRM|nr:response regulator transcription factor [Lutispora thermophila]SHI45111.1 two component transcriptional regulator, LuxR family [Lutispora thermophila DSM 19022]
MNKIKILIADDHSLVREGIKQLLELEEDFEVVGQAANGLETLEKIKEFQPDVLLLDINMPVMGGIPTLRKIKEQNIEVKTVILTIHEGREYLMETLELGALGYVLKDSDSASLSKAIRDAYKGISYIQPKLAAELVREFNSSKTYKTNNENELTKREYEVLSLIADGMNNKDIADKLFISEKTVKNHVSSIFRKINVNDRTKAAIYAYKNNIKW